MDPLRVTYRTALDSGLRVCMTTKLIKYLLYMRGQIPCLYDELLQFVECYELRQQERVEAATQRRLPAGGGIKKALKCVGAAELLFGVQLDAIFSLRVKRVALVFGSSLMSPRDAIVVDFEEAETQVEDVAGLAVSSVAASPEADLEDMSLDDSLSPTPPSPPTTREKLMRLCTQKLMRAVFTHAMDHFSRAFSATKLHVAVLAERQSTRIPGFIPKQQFKLRLPKDKHGVRTHYIMISSNVDSKKHSQQEDSQQSASMQTLNGSTSSMDNESSQTSCNVDNVVQASATASTSDSDLMWYVLEKPIPGFSEVITMFDGQ